MQVRLGDHLDFSNGRGSRPREANGRFPVYGANGAIGYARERNAVGPLIVVGRVGSYCGSLHYCDSDVWVTENALVCRAKNPGEIRYWYYALQTCRLNEHRAGSGQPVLNQRVLRDVVVRTAAAEERRQIAEVLGAFDDKIAANRRAIDAAEALMVATVESVCDRVPLCSLASRSSAFLDPEEFDDTVAHFSFSAYDGRVWPELVDRRSVNSGKFLLPAPCVLVSKLNPRIPRIWDVVGLPDGMSLASTEFVVLRPLDVGTSALWSALRQPGVSETLRQQAAGTSGSRQRIQPRDLMEIPVRDVRRLSPETARAVADLGALCHARRAECVRLSAFRDLMLPLLMSGTVRITDT
ncbi:MAG TPA: restriction endonuclease subunit S [Mycobacterium sp.]|nr:restriction endonuclease subunit S [Mycobacterium sp.]